MGFFSGRVAFSRFRVNGPSPGSNSAPSIWNAWTPMPLASTPRRLRRRRNRLDRRRPHSRPCLWAGKEHRRRRAALRPARGYRQAAVRPVGAYTQEELVGLAASNPSGRPSARQKRDARQAALQRLEDEARDGRFLKRKAYPVLWDAPSNELLIGSTAAGEIDRLLTLFEATFGIRFEPVIGWPAGVSPGCNALQTRAIDDASPSAFVPGGPVPRSPGRPTKAIATSWAMNTSSGCGFWPRTMVTRSSWPTAVSSPSCRPAP